MGVAIAKSHPYMVSNAFPGTWRPHAKCMPDWSLINFPQPQKIPVGVGMGNNTHYHAHMCFIMPEKIPQIVLIPSIYDEFMSLSPYVQVFLLKYHF